MYQYVYQVLGDLVASSTCLWDERKWEEIKDVKDPSFGHIHEKLHVPRI